MPRYVERNGPCLVLVLAVETYRILNPETIDNLEVKKLALTNLISEAMPAISFCS